MIHNYLLLVLVPPPQITFDTYPSVVPLYEGTDVALSCIVTLNTTVVNTNVKIFSAWIGPDGRLLNYSSRVILLSSMQSSVPYYSGVEFAPVDDSDGGSYQCRITVAPSAADDSILPAVSSSVAKCLHPIG